MTPFIVNTMHPPAEDKLHRIIIIGVSFIRRRGCRSRSVTKILPQQPLLIIGAIPRLPCRQTHKSPSIVLWRRRVMAHCFIGDVCLTPPCLVLPRAVCPLRRMNGLDAALDGWAGIMVLRRHWRLVQGTLYLVTSAHAMLELRWCFYNDKRTGFYHEFFESCRTVEAPNQHAARGPRTGVPHWLHSVPAKYLTFLWMLPARWEIKQQKLYDHYR